MREIKFRIWDEEMKKIKYLTDIHDSFYFDKNGNACYFNLQGGYGGIPMQYTGIKDKNGNEIYEGDIVKIVGLIPGTEDFVGVVRFSDCSYILENVKKETGIFLFQDGVDMFVIGNVYENKELLEEE